MKFKYWIIILIIVVIGLMVWGVKSKDAKYANLSTREVSKICTTDMATQFHIHPELEIYIDEVKTALPTNIGIEADGCMHPLHTHDSTGIVHVESPVKRDFTLGDFFAVWGQPFPANAVMTVDGATSTAFESLVLQDKAKIVIKYQSVKP